jgi:histidinol dehydrogenase
MKKIKREQIKPEFFDYKEIGETIEVQKIIHEVRKRKDQAVKEFTLKFDGVKLEQMKIDKDEIKESYGLVNKDLILSIKKTVENLRIFSKKQMEGYKNFTFEIKPGVFVGQRVIPINRAGIYVPGGRYPLISSLIMGAVPAQVAGVSEVMVCSPPCFKDSVHPGILVAAELCGVEEIYKVGGVQAVAAMAYGTPIIQKVNKIVGPGNRYVTAAKKIVFGQVGIDFMAGPTETLIIADKKADPCFVAADLIAQAEHDFHAEPILVTDSDEWADKVIKEIGKGLKKLSNPEVAEISLKNKGLIIIVKNWDEAVELANQKAPEHLQLNLDKAEDLIPKLTNYGSLFVGSYSPVVLADYSCGLNHTLPTNSASKYTGGLSVGDFLKIQTSLQTNKYGFLKVAPAAKCLAEAEGLEGHRNSVSIRLNKK